MLINSDRTDSIAAQRDEIGNWHDILFDKLVFHPKRSFLWLWSIKIFGARFLYIIATIYHVICNAIIIAYHMLNKLESQFDFTFCIYFSCLAIYN